MWPRLRLPLVLLCFALLATLGGCATSGVNRGDLNLISPDEEWQMGQQLEQDVNQQVRLVNDRTLTSYVSRMGQRIVGETPMADRRWKFHVVADDQVNAFNIPGGHVYVHTGLIKRAGNASELAGVLAHEISHGVSRHATEQLSKRQGLSLGAGVLLGSDPSTLERLATQIAASGAVAKFSRNDEREADALGIRYMYEAGYDPRGLASMFEKLLAERERSPSALGQFFSTHPLTSERIAEARRRAAQLPERSGLIRSGGRDFTAARTAAQRY